MTTGKRRSSVIMWYAGRIMTRHYDEAFSYLLFNRNTSEYKFDYSLIAKVVTTALLYLRVNSMSNVSIQGKPADFGEDKKKELFPLWPLLWPTRKATRTL
jgi:hypothetical protein